MKPRAARPFVSVLAPAKLNTYLEVLGRREDGFHELDTVMVAIDLADQLRIERSDSPGVRLVLSGPAASEDIPIDGRNLAVRAAEFVLEDARRRGRVGTDVGLILHLHKRIPSQSGLGGGSSDAAAACLGTAELLASGTPAASLRSWLSELGSDCVFFYDAAMTGIARCKGRGERVQCLDRIEGAWSFALLSPAIPIPTPEVFAALGRSLSEAGELPSVPEKLFSCNKSEARRGLFNRLEAAALSAVPELGAWRDLLDQNGAQHFVLSGSGSTYFGLYSDPKAANAALEVLACAARQSDLELRGTWVAQPLGRGVQLLPAESEY